MLEYLSNSVDVFTILTFVLALMVTYLIWDNFYGIRVNIPGPTPWPIVGNLPSLAGTTNAAETLMKFQKIYGDLIFMRFGKLPFVIAFGYDKVHKILVENANKTKYRPDNMYIFKKIYPNGPGVVLSNGQAWSDIRKLSMVALKDFGVGKKTIEQRIIEEVDYLVDLFKKDSTPDISLVFSKASSNIISNIIFGSRFDYEDKDFNEILECVKYVFKHGTPLGKENIFPILDKVNPYSKLSSLAQRRRKTEDYIRSRIDEQRESFDPNNIRNFLDLYLDHERHANNRIPEERLFLTITDLYLAGTDTTSLTLQWSMLYMLMYPKVQKKCRNEIKEVLGERAPTLKDKENLPFVMATLNEAQRKSTIVPMALPHMANEDIYIDGMLIPKGTVILCCLTSVHFDPKLWEEPDEFRPERFLSKEGKLIKNDALIQFSLGPRLCLGKQLAEAEVFLFFTSFLQRFKLTRGEEETDLSGSGIQTGITAQPPPFTIKFTPL